MANTNSDDALVLHTKSFLSESGPGVKDEAVDEIVKNLMATPETKQFTAEILAATQGLPKQMVTTMALAGWTNQCSANSQIGCVIFFMTARLAVSDPVNRGGTSQNGGLYTPGFQTTWGTYGYNDINIQGGSVTTMVTCQGVSAQITVFKNNQPIGFYVGGGVGTVAGTGGGTMSW